MLFNVAHKLLRIVLILFTLLLASCSWFSDKNEEKPSDVYLQLGVRYMDLNRLEIAKENFEKAIEKDNGNAKAHSAMAYLFEKINHYDDARKQYQTALDLSPDDVGIQNNFGRFLCDRREFDKGLSLLKRATDNLLNDRQWIGLTNAARCYLGKGQREKATILLRQALDMNSQYPPALSEMQKISYQIGDYQASKEYLHKYLAQANHTPETLWIAHQTEQVLGNHSLANEYRTLLLDKFPLSNEAKQLAGIR
jgi:type IV pilus assembly protein PilF